MISKKDYEAIDAEAEEYSAFLKDARVSRAEIERLEKEVERLREGWTQWVDERCIAYNTAYNDAIEAAANLLNLDEACVDEYVKIWAKDRMEVIRNLKRSQP